MMRDIPHPHPLSTLWRGVPLWDIVLKILKCITYKRCQLINFPLNFPTHFVSLYKLSVTFVRSAGIFINHHFAT